MCCMTQFLLFKMDEVTSSPDACSWKHYATLPIHVPLQKLDDILEELHGSHYIFILLRKESRCKRKYVVCAQSCMNSVNHPAVKLVSEVTFWQVSMNSSIVTTPSLFRSIFWNTSDMERRDFIFSQVWNYINLRYKSLLWNYIDDGLWKGALWHFSVKLDVLFL